MTAQAAIELLDCLNKNFPGPGSVAVFLPMPADLTTTIPANTAHGEQQLAAEWLHLIAQSPP